MKARLTSLNAFTAELLATASRASPAVRFRSRIQAGSRIQECLRTLQAQDEWQGNLPVRRSDGIYRRIAFRGRRMKLHGERPFILIHGIDVTEQHEAEEALHLATRQRELILESVGDGIYGIDLEGRLTFINEAGAIAGVRPGRA